MNDNLFVIGDYLVTKLLRGLVGGHFIVRAMDQEDLIHINKRRRQNDELTGRDLDQFL